jgi:hypothetical protein
LRDSSAPGPHRWSGPSARARRDHRLAILAMVVMAAATLLFVLGLVPFSATVTALTSA